MKKHPLRTLLIFVGITFLVICLINAVRRDIYYDRDYTCDLRNRVVGARLIEDGKSPYFYKWSEADSTRYYDPTAFGNFKVSNITASPFFHELLIPIADYPEATISRAWLWIEYIMFLSIVLIALSFCDNAGKKTALIFTAVAFLFTEAWKEHVCFGQMYLVIAFLSSLFIYLLSRPKHSIIYLSCGIIAAALILIRPNFIIFFLPLVVLFPRFKMKEILALMLPGILGVMYILFSPFQRQLWSDFFSAVKVHTKIHQGEALETGTFPADPKYALWEGICRKDINTITPDMNEYPKSENGNFFVLYRFFLHKKMGASGLLITSSILIVLLFFGFIYFTRRVNVKNEDLKILACLGFCFYMISDLFSPIYRHQYYTVQWFPAVLFFLTAARLKRDLWFVLLIITGVFLNMINVPLIKMEHTIGEYLLLFVLTCYSLFYFNRKSLEA